MPEQQHHSVYEYPLQERFRTYLRFEHSFTELQRSLDIATQAPQAFFHALLSAQELVERNDVKTDLAKDLELQRQAMQRWQDHPQIDQSALQAALHSISLASDNLQQLNKELRALKDDRFLAAIRSRFLQPGVTGLFELPQLQLWLSQTDANQQAHRQHWYQALQPLAAAIELQLELTRQQGDFSQVVANNGFWQESCEPLALLRIKLPHEARCYPVVSGHRQRFTLRFMSLPDNHHKTDTLSDSISFALARCPLLAAN